MKPRLILIIGIILLITGIILRVSHQFEYLGLTLISMGVLCKLFYIHKSAKQGIYKPGKELFVLGLGLILLFTGLYAPIPENALIKPVFLIILGILFKIIFVLWFIQRIRSTKKTK